jgi:hypothetical protein
MKIETFLGSNSGGRVYTVRKLEAQIRIPDVLFLAAFFVLATGHVLAQSGDNVTFKTGVHLVVVPAMVRDAKGNAVAPELHRLPSRRYPSQFRGPRAGAGRRVRNIDASWPIFHMAIFTTSGQGDASTPERRDH